MFINMFPRFRNFWHNWRCIQWISTQKSSNLKLYSMKMVMFMAFFIVHFRLYPYFLSSMIRCLCVKIEFLFPISLLFIAPVVKRLTYPFDFVCLTLPFEFILMSIYSIWFNLILFALIPSPYFALPWFNPWNPCLFSPCRSLSLSNAFDAIKPTI